MNLRTIAILTLGISVLVAAGCNSCGSHPPHHQRWSTQPVYPGTPSTNAPAVPAVPEVLTPTSPGVTNMPPLNPPSSSRFAPPNLPPDLLPPTNVPLDARYYGDPTAPRTETREPPLAPAKPFAAPAEQPDNSGKQPLPPDLRDPNQPERIPAPALIENSVEKGAAVSFPDGISGFMEVKDRVAAGLRPEPEGLDWLKEHGYKTVLHIRRPGTAHSADREQIEKRGMKYLSLEVSADILNASLAAEFNAIVAERGNRPLFVYDKDGTLAGAMWYLYFRIAESMLPEAARVRAGQLGLKTTATELWIAIQKVAVP